MYNGDKRYAPLANSKTTKWLQKHGIAISYIGVVIIIIFELVPQVPISISWEIIALIALLLVSPFIGNIKRIWVSNVGGLELESDIESTQKLVSEFLEQSPDIRTEPTERGEKSPESETDTQDSISEKIEFEPEEYIDDLGGHPREISDELYRLLESDPRLALAKLRMEMEETVNSLLETMGYQKPRTHHERYEIMKDIDDLDQEVLHTHREIRDLCNRAIHGEEIRMQDAIEIVDMGLDFMTGMKLRELYERFKSGEEIDEEELDALLGQSSALLNEG